MVGKLQDVGRETSRGVSIGNGGWGVLQRPCLGSAAMLAQRQEKCGKQDGGKCGGSGKGEADRSKQEASEKSAICDNPSNPFNPCANLKSSRPPHRVPTPAGNSCAKNGKIRSKCLVVNLSYFMTTRCYSVVGIVATFDLPNFPGHSALGFRLQKYN